MCRFCRSLEYEMIYDMKIMSGGDWGGGLGFRTFRVGGSIQLCVCASGISSGYSCFLHQYKDCVIG